MMQSDGNALEKLRNEPHRYSLFAALRAIERAFAERPRLGESRRAEQDPVRLAQTPHLSFAPSDIAAVETNAAARLVVEAYSFGMFGPNGALPLHLTEVAYERRRQLADPTIADFINVFQHRLIALFYRAWADADPTTNFDRPTTDRFRTYLGAFVGLASDQARDRDCVSDYAKLGRVAQYGAQARSAEGLADVLADFFELPFVVRPFVGTWLAIPAESRSRLGGHDESAQLGVGVALGGASWQCQHKFEIAVGPLDYAAFANFLPGSAGLRDLAALVKLYTNDEWDWQLRLLLRGEQRPELRLGLGAQLGWSTWMGGKQSIADEVAIQGALCENTH